MKIAHIAPDVNPAWGGIGKTCYYYALGAARHGHDVHIFAPVRNLNQGYIFPSELTLHHPPRLGQCSRRSGRAPALDSFDVIHLHLPYYPGAASLALCSLAKTARCVVSYYHDPRSDGLHGLISQTWHKLAGRRLLANARRLTVLSCKAARTLQLAREVCSQPERVVELAAGADPYRFHPQVDPGNLRHFYGISPTDRLILFVAELDAVAPDNGLEILLHSLALISAPHVKLLVIGDGPQRAHYQALAHYLDVDRRVIFRGWVSYELLSKHYAMSDLIALPARTVNASLYTTLFEAMLCARPVLTSALPGIHPLVEDGQTGLLAQPGDVLQVTEKLLSLVENDPAWLNSLGERGWDIAQRDHTWAAILPQLIEIYQTL